MTFKQAIGGAVRKGERASLTVYTNSITRTAISEVTGEVRDTEIRYMKGYAVFNAEQIDGLAAHYTARLTQGSTPVGHPVGSIMLLLRRLARIPATPEETPITHLAPIASRAAL